jgi:two-component system response regulator FlrC
MTTPKVLIVEDDGALREALADTLGMAGFEVSAAADGPQALQRIDAGEQPAIVVTDVHMQPMDGHGLLHELRARRPDLPVILMTAYGTIELAVQAMREGAADYLVKPFEADVLVDLVVKHAGSPAGAAGGNAPVAEDPASREVVELARRVARADCTVLITGESGTGKEVFARYVHAQSERADGPFVAINCAAIPENMLEAILFGHEKGAFTGAHEARRGKFELANGGTLLLDEVSEMDLGLQAKLLRVLQEREVERLGGRKTIALDVRVIATSNRNLREEVAEGRFREDLFYRLSVFPLALPALRERRADILPLARTLLTRHSNGTVRPQFSAAAEQALLGHDWPGNVRELDNVIQRALILCAGHVVQPQDMRFEPCMMATPQPSASAGLPLTDQPATDPRILDDQLKRREGELIIEALRSGNGSRKEAAARLGISPRTLRYKLARLREAGVAIPA